MITLEETPGGHDCNNIDDLAFTCLKRAPGSRIEYTPPHLATHPDHHCPCHRARSATHACHASGPPAQASGHKMDLANAILFDGCRKSTPTAMAAVGRGRPRRAGGKGHRSGAGRVRVRSESMKVLTAGLANVPRVGKPSMSVRLQDENSGCALPRSDNGPKLIPIAHTSLRPSHNAGKKTTDLAETKGFPKLSSESRARRHRRPQWGACEHARGLKPVRAQCAQKLLLQSLYG